MKKILLYNSGGGLGDSIQLMSLILSLQNHFKESQLLYLGAHANHFNEKLKEFNIKIKTLDLDIKYFGFRWWHFILAKKYFTNKNLEKIDLIIDLQSKLRNSLILKRIPHIHFYSTTLNSFLCSKKIKFKGKNHIDNLNNFLNEKIKLIEFKLSFLSNKIIDEAKRLLPKSNYIGFSLTQGNEYRKKSLSIYKFISLANKIDIKGKIPVFFIEKDMVEIIDKVKNQVPSVLIPETQSELSCPALVTALASRLDLAITIDNGVMHMMSLANIPMIVLFGPTNSNKFAPRNDNIKILDSKKIYNTEDIDAITVDDVFNLI